MNDILKRAIENLLPFILLGIALALLAGLFIMFSYLLVWGFFIGLVLWAIAAVKDYFFSKNTQASKRGRIIEHNHHENK